MNGSEHMSDNEPSAMKARKAWQQLVASGAATKYVAELMSVGLVDEYVRLFSDKYFGPEAYDTFKLVLGLNGEGKTHFLHCVEARALEMGHVVALVEAKQSGAGESPLGFAREVFGSLRVSSATGTD